MCPAVFLTNMHEGTSQRFALPCADISDVFTIFCNFTIIQVFLQCFPSNFTATAIYCNSMDVTLFAADTPAALFGSAPQQNSSSSSQQTFPPISSSLSSSAQLSPDFLATVVQANKLQLLNPTLCPFRRRMTFNVPLQFQNLPRSWPPRL